MCCFHYCAQQLQLHCSQSLLCVRISVGYSQCCYADLLEPSSDSSAVTLILRQRPGVLIQKQKAIFGTEEKLPASLDLEGGYL